MHNLTLVLQRYMELERLKSGVHPPPEHLAAYWANRLDSEAQEGIRDHLVICETCRAEYLDWHLGRVNDEAREPSVLQEAAWRHLWQRISEQDAGDRDRGRGQTPAVQTLRTRIRRFGGDWPLAALAASVVACTGLGLWGLATQARLDLALQPVVNPAIVELVPEELQIRRGGLSERAHEVSSASSWVQLVVHVPPERLLRDLAHSPDSAHLTLFDLDGKPTWSSPPLKPNEYGLFVVLLPRSLLPTGEYRLVLSWDGSSQITDYRLIMNSTEDG